MTPSLCTSHSQHTQPQHANYNMKLKIRGDQNSAHYNPISNIFNHMQIIHQLKIDLRLICNTKWNTIKQFVSTILQNNAFYFSYCLKFVCLHHWNYKFIFWFYFITQESKTNTLNELNT